MSDPAPSQRDDLHGPSVLYGTAIGFLLGLAAAGLVAAIAIAGELLTPGF
jgi:hypothetical protein